MGAMDDKLDSAIREKVLSIMADEIISKLSTDQRNQILSKGIASILDDWSFKNQIEKTLAAHVATSTELLLQTNEYQKKIAEKVREGVDLLLEQIPEAVRQAFGTALFGMKGDSSYNHIHSQMIGYLKIQSPKN